MLGAFGDQTDGPEDLDGDGWVTVNDVLVVIGAWGPC
jgi:hypothetical protein